MAQAESDGAACPHVTFFRIPPICVKQVRLMKKAHIAMYNTWFMGGQVGPTHRKHRREDVYSRHRSKSGSIVSFFSFFFCCP